MNRRTLQITAIVISSLAIVLSCFTLALIRMKSKRITAIASIIAPAAVPETTSDDPFEYRFVQQPGLPPGHSLYYNEQKHGWLPVYHNLESYAFPGDSFYLVPSYLSAINYCYVQMYQTLEYAQAFQTRDSALWVIKRHWKDILADRASHKTK